MSNKESYIGVFDSGIGGLTVAESIMESLPNENIIYFGDTAHLPYGTKSEKQIMEYVFDDVNFLQQFNLKALVVACNTADSVARRMLKKQYDLPIFGVIKPASFQAAKTSKNHRIGVMATTATVRSGAYPQAIHQFDKNAEVFTLACPLLVPLVENGRYDKDDIVVTTILQEYLDQLLIHDIDTLVLGCTHYPLLMEAIQYLAPHINVISSSDAAAEALRIGLEERDLLSETGNGANKYFVSDDAEHFGENARLFLKDHDDIAAELVTLPYDTESDRAS